jgi:RNA polymerase sigma-70 factor (ECF subfamily)
VQAAIAAVHAGLVIGEETDWGRVLELYDELIRLHPSPVAALNRVVALARVAGPKVALEALQPLRGEKSLRNYYLLPAVEGRLLMDIGERGLAVECFRRALERPCSEPERRFLQRRLRECQRA